MLVAFPSNADETPYKPEQPVVSTSSSLDTIRVTGDWSVVKAPLIEGDPRSAVWCHVYAIVVNVASRPKAAANRVPARGYCEVVALQNIQALCRGRAAVPRRLSRIVQSRTPEHWPLSQRVKALGNVSAPSLIRVSRTARREAWAWGRERCPGRVLAGVICDGDVPAFSNNQARQPHLVDTRSADHQRCTPMHAVVARDR